jgi:hypothetical protein
MNKMYDKKYLSSVGINLDFSTATFSSNIWAHLYVNTVINTGKIDMLPSSVFVKGWNDERNNT